MKKLLLYLTIFTGISTISQSCKKNRTNEPIIKTITESLSVNQSYQFDLGSFGDEEGASISRQANHFSTSLVEWEFNTGKIIYKYVPAINFVGTDEVEIKSARGSNGASPNNKILLTKIKFIVTN